jgi:hypothetical protein
MPCPSHRPAPSHPTPHLRGRTRFAAATLLLALAAAPARAEAPFEGRYQGRGEGRLSLTVSSRGGAGPGATHTIDAFTGIPNACSGTISGVARRVDADTLRLSVKGDEAVCEITLRFGPDRKRVRMDEQECGNFHGPACAFDGTLTRR